VPVTKPTKETQHKDSKNTQKQNTKQTKQKQAANNNNNKLKAKFGSVARKTFDSFITKDSFTTNVTRNTESTAV
jgi:hypothetical protein